MKDFWFYSSIVEATAALVLVLWWWAEKPESQWQWDREVEWAQSGGLGNPGDPGEHLGGDDD